MKTKTTIFSIFILVWNIRQVSTKTIITIFIPHSKGATLSLWLARNGRTILIYTTPMYSWLWKRHGQTWQCAQLQLILAVNPERSRKQPSGSLTPTLLPFGPHDNLCDSLTVILQCNYMEKPLEYAHATHRRWYHVPNMLPSRLEPFTMSHHVI
jgi:hypothetical protein